MKGMIREGVIIGGMICLYLVCAASLKQSIPEPQTYEEARELFLKFQIKQNVTEEEALRQFDLMRRKLSAAYKENEIDTIVLQSIKGEIRKQKKVAGSLILNSLIFVYAAWFLIRVVKQASGKKDKRGKTWKG